MLKCRALPTTPSHCRGCGAGRNHLSICSQPVPDERAPGASDPGMMMINLAKAATPLGAPAKSDREFGVFVAAFEEAGAYDPRRAGHVPDIRTLRGVCAQGGRSQPRMRHWIQQQKPEETTQAILNWLANYQATWTHRPDGRFFQVTEALRCPS